MKLLADEGVDSYLVQCLRDLGYEVDWVAECMPAATDEQVLQQSVLQKAILVTSDTDFGNLIFLRGHAQYGVVLFRLHGLSRSEKIERVKALFTEHQEKLPRHFSVLSESQVRIRKLPVNITG